MCKEIHKTFSAEVDSQGQACLVNGVENRKIVVTSMVISEGRQAMDMPAKMAVYAINYGNMTGGPIMGNVDLAQPLVLPYHPAGWFETGPGVSLVMSGGYEGRSVEGCLTYRLED